MFIKYHSGSILALWYCFKQILSKPSTLGESNLSFNALVSWPSSCSSKSSAFFNLLTSSMDLGI
jgi:hypothetical protein